MELTDQQFAWVACAAREIAAIELPPGKEYLVESRLRALAERLGFAGIATLVTAARGADQALKAKVVEAMTVNETSWFRDRDPFRCLVDTAIPEVLSAHNRPMRVWSAACSSGQETYSIAIELQRALPPGRGFEVLGTDLSERMVAKAKAGRFNQLEVNRGLPAADLVAHFDRVGPEWMVDPLLRSRVSFRTLNLARPLPPLPRFDVVFLRNVLIYFAPAAKRDVLRRVRGVLRPGGWLLLGAAETTVGIDAGFERVPVGRTAIYRTPLDDRQPVKEVTPC